MTKLQLHKSMGSNILGRILGRLCNFMCLATLIHESQLDVELIWFNMITFQLTYLIP